MNRTDDLIMIIGELRSWMNNMEKQRTECISDRRKKEKSLNFRLENIMNKINKLNNKIYIIFWLLFWFFIIIISEDRKSVLDFFISIFSKIL